MKVRPARLDDDATLHAIDVDTWDETVTPGPRPKPDAPFFRDAEAIDRFWVAEVDGRVVGYVSLTEEYSLESARHVLQVSGLAVAHERRRQGIGLALLQAAIAESRRQGARRLTLHVLGSNSPALRLYEREGFVVEGVQRQQFFLRGKYVDDILLALTL